MAWVNKGGPCGHKSGGRGWPDMGIKLARPLSFNANDDRHDPFESSGAQVGGVQSRSSSAIAFCCVNDWYNWERVFRKLF